MIRVTLSQYQDRRGDPYYFVDQTTDPKGYQVQYPRLNERLSKAQTHSLINSGYKVIVKVPAITIHHREFNQA